MNLNLSSGGQEPSWFLKYGARGVGCGGGIIAIGLGLVVCITFDSDCLLGGIFQMLAGFIVVAAEAPCCCMFIEFVDRYSKWVEARPHWQKAALYIAVSLPPLFFCFSMSTFFGCGLLFLAGVLYGMMAIGKKAPRNEMMASAAASETDFNLKSINMKSTLVDSEVPPATS